MSNITTFPCEYLVADTGYTGRLIENEMIEGFDSFCVKHKVTPLFIYDSHRMDNVGHLGFRNGKTYPHEATHEQMALNNQLLERISHEPQFKKRGLIVFQTGTFFRAGKVITHLRELEYCNLSDIEDIDFLSNDKGVIDMAYVSWDSESG